MRIHFTVIIFFFLNFFLIFLSIPDLFNNSISITHANTLNNFQNIGVHEYENFGLLNVSLGKIDLFNIFFTLFFLLSICSFGFICLKKTFCNFCLKVFDDFEKNIILYIASFTLGSLIFVGIYRILSLNISIPVLNNIILIYLVFFLFYYFYKFNENLKILIKNKFLNLSLILLLVLILLLQIDMGQHHLIGDAFYNFGFNKIIKPLSNSDYIPIVGTHYFEEIFIFPIVYFLQDFFFSTNVEYSTFQVMWVFQAFGKLSSICLTYISFRFFEKSKIRCLFYTIIIFATNLSGHYFYNPVLYDSGNPFLLNIHTSRSSGLILFFFITACYFLKPKYKASFYNYLICGFFLVGISSLGIQYSFLFMLFFIFLYLHEIGSIKIVKNFQKFIYKSFNINIFLSILLILVTYLLVGQKFVTYTIAPYLILISLFLSFLNLYSLNFSNNNFNLKYFNNYNLLFLIFVISLVFLGNIFTYKFLFPVSPNKIEIIQVINNSILSNLSHVNKILFDGDYIYRSLIHYEEQNIYQLKNICTLRSELGLKIAGIPSYHCKGGILNFLFGLGFILTILIFNSFFIKNINFSTKNNNYLLFLYSLSLFYFMFALFFNDMIDGRYLVHPRTRFLELPSILIIIVFFIILSKNITQSLNIKIIFTILIMKIIFPFYLNFVDEKSWYLNQLMENIKYLFLIN